MSESEVCETCHKQKVACLCAAQLAVDGIKPPKPEAMTIHGGIVTHDPNVQTEQTLIIGKEVCRTCHKRKFACLCAAQLAVDGIKPPKPEAMRVGELVAIKGVLYTVRKKTKSDVFLRPFHGDLTVSKAVGQRLLRHTAGYVVPQ